MVIFKLFSVLSDLTSKWLKLTYQAGKITGAITGLVGGLGIGVALGILFAPRSGRELRDELKERARSTVEDLDDRSKQIRSMTAEFLHSDAPANTKNSQTRKKRERTAV